MNSRTFKNITIIIDTREQNPLEFIRCPSEIGTLTTGDYSVKGLESYLCIERKTIPDLVASSCSKQRERFEAELHRSMAYKWSYLIIEGNVAEVYAGEYRSKANPESVIASVLSFSVRYGIAPIFAGNVGQAVRIVEHLCLMVIKNLDSFAEELGYEKIPW